MSPPAAWSRRVVAALALLAALAAPVVSQANATCPSGFTGPGCALCQTDAACAAATGNAAATCSADLAFAPNSANKTFACSLPADGLLGGLLEPGSLVVSCATAAGGTTCGIGFVVKSPRVQVQCAATGCSFVAGQSNLTCASTTCTCPADPSCGNSTLISSLANGVSGQATLGCNTTSGACVMAIAGLPVAQIDATCQAAECLVPGGSAAPGPAPAVPAAPLPAPRPSPVPSPSPSPAPAPAPAGACADGWEGNSCSLCKTDYSCMAKEHGGVGNELAKCSRNFTFAPNSVHKSWSCELKGSGLLNDLLVPGTLLVQCFTGLQAGQQLGGGGGSGAPGPAPAAQAAAPTPSPAAAAPPPSPAAASPPPPAALTLPGAIDSIIGAAGGAAAAPAPAGGRRLLASGEQQPRCEIGFRVKSPAVGVTCLATGCGMAAGSTQVACNQTKCTCDVEGCGSATIQGLIGSATGQAKLQCDAAGNCTIELQGLPISQLDATCQAGECLEPTDTQLNETSTDQSSGTKLNSNPIIAAVPLMVLVLVAALTGGYTWRQRSMWGVAVSPANLAALEALAAKPAPLAHRVGVLEFEGLTVSVPLNGKEAERKAQALRRKAMQRAASRADGLDAGGEAGSGLLRLVAAAKTALHVPGFGAGADPERGASSASSHLDRTASAEEQAAAAEAAEFVVGLHQSAERPDKWFILRNCSGSVHGGQVVGLLGPSGCGKTTLLGAIAGSATELGGATSLGGTVQVDGVRRRKSQVAYVPQSDVLIPSLTVQECLRYSALLRLPQATSPLDLQLHIDRVLDELGLRHIADAPVGGSGGIRGVSGGERRRVTIGMELVTDPSILVLDEPTSGLDSYTADILMAALKRVAAPGRVVVASLHQPSRDVFHSLDQVVLMGHGHMLYMGRPDDAEAWFERRGLPCPAGTAMAEHMLRVASDAPAIRSLLRALQAEHGSQPGSPRPPRRGSSRAALLPGGGAPAGGASGGSSEDAEGGGLSISKSPFEAPLPPDGKGSPPSSGALQLSPASSTEGSVEALPAGKAADAAPPPAPKRRKASYGRQLSVMFWRTYVDIVRNPALLLLHSLVALAMGLITGLVFFDLDETNIGVQNRMGSTFFALAFLAFTSLTTVDLLIAERQVVTREVRGGYYDPTAYLLSKLTLDALLLRVLPAIWYFLAFYYLAGFQTGSVYAASYCFILITFSCVVGAMSMCITIVSNTAGQASFAMNFTLLFSLVFTGFLVNVNSIPAWIRWIHYLSVFYYAFEAMITGELSGRLFTVMVNGSTIPNVKGETFLETLGFKPGQTTTDIGVLVGIYFLMVLLALALFFLRLPRQRSIGGAPWWRAWRGARARRAAADGAPRRASTLASGRWTVASEAEAPNGAGHKHQQ